MIALTYIMQVVCGLAVAAAAVTGTRAFRHGQPGRAIFNAFLCAVNVALIIRLFAIRAMLQ